MDDIIIGHHNKSLLSKMGSKVVRKLELALWPVNFEKSIFISAKEEVFLEAKWSASGETRQGDATSTDQILLKRSNRGAHEDKGIL